MEDHTSGAREVGDFRITNNDGGTALSYIARHSTKNFLIFDSIVERVITRERQMSREIRAREKWLRLPGTKTPVVNN